MNQNYWAEKHKNQTQMLRVIHDQMNELSENMQEESNKVNKTMGILSGYIKDSTDSYIKNRKSHDKLIKHIDQLAYTITQWAPITPEQKEEFKKLFNQIKKERKK